MRISEMQARENLDAILQATLEEGWTRQYGRPFRIEKAGSGAGQPWRVQALLSAYYPLPLGAAARCFLRDGFRYTPVPWRWLPQFVLGTFLGSRSGLACTGRAAFRVQPEVPGAGNLIVVPGNQRIRSFDFASGRSRVWLKKGFDARTMRNEIEIRGGGRKGPFPPIGAHDEAGRWFEEAILDGFTLPRCPPWRGRRGYEREAFRLLETWQAPSAERGEAGAYAASLGRALREDLRRLRSSFSDAGALVSEAWIEVLAEEAARLGNLQVARTHGDFQPGNIMVERATEAVRIIDWEHGGRRFIFYDHFVYGLKSRSGRGLARRLRAYIEKSGEFFPLDMLPFDARGRRAALALFLLEDLRWFVREHFTGPFLSLSQGFRRYVKELAMLGPRLEGLFGGAA